MPAPLVERHDETARGLGARREAVVDQRARRVGRHHVAALAHGRELLLDVKVARELLPADL